MTSTLDMHPSEGIGVESQKQPSAEELELIDHIWVHNNAVHTMRLEGWIEYDCAAADAAALYNMWPAPVPGYYKLMYRED
jgi:hypothetical protein